MNPYRVIDKSTWPRRDVFNFFMGFDNPCFSLSIMIDATAIYARAKQRGESFFLLCLYAILRAANEVPQMRQRVIDDVIMEFERIAAMTPIMTEHEIYRQVWCEYAPTFAEFAAAVRPLIESAKRDMPSPMRSDGQDFICTSCTPWIHFTSITPAEFHFGQAIPILTWGKMKDGLIPFSCKFNHAFIDGLHVARFFDAITHSFAHPDTLG